MKERPLLILPRLIRTRFLLFDIPLFIYNLTDELIRILIIVVGAVEKQIKQKRISNLKFKMLFFCKRPVAHGGALPCYLTLYITYLPFKFLAKP